MSYWLMVLVLRFDGRGVPYHLPAFAVVESPGRELGEWVRWSPPILGRGRFAHLALGLS